MRLTVVPTDNFSWIKKQGVVLMLVFSFLLTILLVQQQQRTIESQRALIRELIGDSVELANLKVKAAMVAHQQKHN